MSTTIIATLSAYGFARRENGLFWGIGSMVWGHSVNVKNVGIDLYEVTIAHWFYNSNGDLVEDSHVTRVLHGALALAWIFEEMPSSFWRQK